jgi:hypothetical protein
MKRLVLGLIALAVIAVLPWGLMTAYVNSNGLLARGEVVEKRESIVMPGGDSWKHVFEIKYQYQPSDSPYRQLGSHRVSPSFYRSLRVGSEVQIRYSSSRFMRTFEGIGSFVVGSSALSRLPYGPPDTRELADLGGIVLAVLIGLIAYSKKSMALGLAAVAVVSASVPVVLLGACGLIVFPSLFWAWRRNPGKGYGWTLLGLIAFTAAVVYWRVPQPATMPAGPVINGSAIVQQTRVVDQIWSSDSEGHASSDGGQTIGTPFEMLDLEFTPEGASEPIHVLDRIDSDSVPGLREGAKVPIYYNAIDPGSARVAAGTRNYARQAAVYLLGLTYCLAAIMTILVFPIVHFVEKFVRSSPIFGGISNSGALVQQWRHLPEDDPRRKAFEQALRQGRGESVNDREM